MKTCKHLEAFLIKSQNEGNLIEEISTGWSKLTLVVDMKNKPSDNLLGEMQLVRNPLRYWHSKKTPHNRGEYGLTCDSCKIVLDFPDSD